MAITIPGLSLSILRQETTVRTGRPLLVSGRFTALGVGMPALIRVYLEGPSYDPQVRSFDTFASPFTGDYSVNVLGEKDGRYTVYSQAFPPPLIPTGPPFPEAILLAPPVAESTRPPLGIGVPVDGGVEVLLPTGERAFIPAPPMQPIEFRPIITVAPGITVTAPGVPAAYPRIPLPPPPPAAPPPPPEVAPPPEVVSAAIEDIRFEPSVIQPAQTAIGLISWRNIGESVRGFDIAFYLLDMVGVRYGPLQIEQDIRVAPQQRMTTGLHLDTEGLPAGVYSVVAEIYDVETGQQVTSRTLPARLTLLAVEIPVPPPAPPPPPPPVVPELPTAEMLGQPSLNLPRQLMVGEIWSGFISMPTYGTIPYLLDARLMLRDPQGFETPVAQVSRVVQPGQALETPVNFNSFGFAPGDYGIILRVMDQNGVLLTEFPMGFLSMLAEVVPPPPPVPPEIPTLPTAAMISVPSLNVPSQVEHGEIWQGNITIPTSWPAVLPAPPTLPSYAVNILTQLESPRGQLFNVSSIQTPFTPGQPINIPISFNTGLLPEPGVHNIIMGITDLQGNQLFSNIIGYLRVLAPPLPPVPPAPPVPSEFQSIVVNLGTWEGEVGDVVRVPVTYVHVGAPETVLLYAAIGNEIVGVFDEVLYGEKTISVGVDPIPTPHDDFIDITITPAIAPGIYDVYAKVNTFVPRVLSPTMPNIIRVLAPPPPPAPPPVAGTITRKELDYQDIWQLLPLYNIPVGTRTRVRITGRNDTSINQKLGIYWFVADPDGLVVQEYTNWETFLTGPGNEQVFVGSGFNLSKVGKYTTWVELLMNPDSPEVVNMYIGDLCTVVE